MVMVMMMRMMITSVVVVVVITHANGTLVAVAELHLGHLAQLNRLQTGGLLPVVMVVVVVMGVMRVISTLPSGRLCCRRLNYLLDASFSFTAVFHFGRGHHLENVVCGIVVQANVVAKRAKKGHHTVDRAKVGQPSSSAAIRQQQQLIEHVEHLRRGLMDRHDDRLALFHGKTLDGRHQRVGGAGI